MSKRQLADPASADTPEAFDWTQADIDAAQAELGRQMMRGKFNPSTWEGEPFTLKFADGAKRQILPRYFGAVLADWNGQQKGSAS